MREIDELDDLDERDDGRLGITVYDKNGNEKDNIEYRRVDGDGAVEARKNKGNIKSSDVSEQNTQYWVVEQRQRTNTE